MKNKKQSLMSRLLDILFPPLPPNPAYSEPLDEDVSFLRGWARPDDTRPSPEELVAKQFTKDGTVYGHKPRTAEVERGRELDRRSALVAPRSGYPDAGEHCGHFCGGPSATPKTTSVDAPDGYVPPIDTENVPKA